MQTDHVAFSIEEASKQRLRQTITDCLSLVATGEGKGCEAQVVVFPEFAVPSDSFLEVEDLLKAEGWPTNTVVVAGVEPISPTEFAKLLSGSSNPNGSNVLEYGAATFINFCVVWTKSADGTVRRYLQPKLKPSALEQARQGMYQGDFVLLFQGDLISFASLICFDCIGEAAHMMAAESLLESIAELAPHGSSINLGLVLVPQFNEYAEHPDFIRFAHQSVRITEKHYAPWMRSRQEQLEADLANAWSHDPLVLLQTEVHQRYTGNGGPTTHSASMRKVGTRGGDRTHHFRALWLRAPVGHYIHYINVAVWHLQAEQG